MSEVAQTLEITARDLKHLVTPLLPMVDTSGMLPLEAVNFEVRDGWLLGTATDRFRLALHRTRTATKHFDALVSARSLRTILATFKASRFADPVLELTVDGGQLLVEQAEAMELEFLSATMRFALVDGPFPDIAEVILEALNGTHGARKSNDWFGVNAGYLADWRHAVTKGSPLYVQVGPSPNRPVIIAVGDDFIGLQMPMRYTEGEPSFSHWLELLGDKVEAGAA